MKYEKRPGLYLNIKSLSIELYWLWYFEPHTDPLFDLNCLESFLVDVGIPRAKAYLEPHPDRVYYRISVDHFPNHDKMYVLSRNNRCFYAGPDNKTDIFKLLSVLCS